MAAGPFRDVLTNSVLSKVFGVPVRVNRREFQWNMSIEEHLNKKNRR